MLPFLPGQQHQNIADAGQDAGIVVFEWVVALALLTNVLFWERLPLRSVGFRTPARRDFMWMAVAFVAMYAGLAVVAVLTHSTSSSSGGATLAQIAAVPLALRIAMFLTAGFCEELMLRAYAIERLALITGKLWIGGVVTIALFTLAHVPRYGFSATLIDVAVIAAALTALYLRTRNFWICAIMHAIIDCFGLVVAPAFAAHAMR